MMEAEMEIQTAMEARIKTLEDEIVWLKGKLKTIGLGLLNGVDAVKEMSNGGVSKKNGFQPRASGTLVR